MRKLTLFLPVAAVTLSLINPALADTPQFKKTWSAAVGGIETMTVDGHNVYYSTSDKLGVIDDRTGKVLWTHNMGPLYWRPSVAYGNGVVCVDASGSVIVAYDAATGKKLWSRPVNSDYTHPIAVHNNAVICQLDRTTLGALDLKTKKTLWKLDLHIGSTGDAFNIDTPPQFLPNGQMVFGVSEHADSDDAPRVLQVLCLTPSGKVAWRHKIAASGPAWVEKVTLDGDKVFASVKRERVIALDVASGSPIWDDKLPSDDFAIVGDALIAAGHGAAQSVQAADGKPLWSTRLTRNRKVDVSGPISTDNNLAFFTGSDTSSQIVSLDADTPVAIDVPATHLKGPAQVDGDGFLVSGTHGLYLFTPGAPNPLPSTTADRKALAAQLVAKFDKLTDDDKFEVAQLGAEALDPLLKLLETRAAKQETPTADLDDRGRFQDVLAMVDRIMRPEYTPQILDVVDRMPANTDALGSYADVLRLLAAKGDDKLTTPLFLKVAQAGSVPGLDGPFEAAMSVLKHSTDPAVVAYFMIHLNDTDGPTRETAYRCLALTGGDAGVDAIRALRRPIRDVADPTGQVLAAAVESQYHFKDTNPSPVVVEMPTGVDTFDMSTFSYLTVHEHGLTPGYDNHLLTFTPPSTDLDGAAYYPNDPAAPILWSEDRTQAKVGIKVFYDPKTSSSYDVTLRKFGNDWLVVDYVELEDN